MKKFNLFKNSDNDENQIMENKSDELATKPEKKSQISGEVLAAIAATITQLNSNHHDKETAILTIKHTNKNYSPWNSKIFSLRQLPRR
jgi:iron-sulfur cluster repair protein YtfE (RIC family)